MEIRGQIRNGMVVLDSSAELPEGALPEGAAVTVTLPAKPRVQIAQNQRRIEFPLVPTSAPGSVRLTNAMIGKILDEEDAPS